jgi:hypothetical protein
MPAPSDSPEFATSANFTVDGDAWGGDPTKADPGAPRKAEGFEPSTLPAEWLNWVLNNHGAWAVWLEDERARLDAYCADTGVVLPAAQTHTRYMAAVSWRSVSGTGAYTHASQPFWTLSTNLAQLSMDISRVLPRAASIRRIAAVVNPGAARTGTDRMILELIGHTVDTPFGTPSISFTVAASQRDDTTTAQQSIVIDLSGSPVPVTDAEDWTLTLTAGTDAAANNDLAYMVIVEFTCATITNE